MAEIRTKIGPGGRIVIPSRYRKKIGVGIGGEVILVLDEEGVRLVTPRQAVARAQALVRKYVRSGEGLARELIEERRREAERG
jgi:bifunctional DNA-binding transcriptional regulator/antitoxin component of YhaV-PrlF toxin-antitoxin module